MKHLTLILFVILSLTGNTQKIISSENISKAINEIQDRIPDYWLVESSKSGIKISFYNEFGFYGVGCCPTNTFNKQEDNKLLKWLKNDYVENLSHIIYFGDTLSLTISFDNLWEKTKIDSVRIAQDSINNYIKVNRLKKKICRNYYWDSDEDKQVIPYRSNRYDCSVFFDKPEYFAGIVKLNYRFEIPYFISMDEEIMMIEQISALVLGINETCFSCNCK